MAKCHWITFCTKMKYLVSLKNKISSKKCSVAPSVFIYCETFLLWISDMSFRVISISLDWRPKSSWFPLLYLQLHICEKDWSEEMQTHCVNQFLTQVGVNPHKELIVTNCEFAESTLADLVSWSRTWGRLRWSESFDLLIKMIVMIGFKWLWSFDQNDLI